MLFPMPEGAKTLISSLFFSNPCACMHIAYCKVEIHSQM